MPWVAEIEFPKRRYCVIQYDPPLGYLIDIYEKDQSFDYYQDTFEQTKGFAFRHFQVPLDAWKEVDESEMHNVENWP